MRTSKLLFVPVFVILLFTAVGCGGGSGGVAILLGQIFGVPATVDSGGIYNLSLTPSAGTTWAISWTSSNSTDIFGTPTGTSTTYVPGTVTQNTAVTITATGTPAGGAAQTAQKVTTILPTTQSITVTSPNGDEVFYRETDEWITWTSVGITGNVRIEYSTDNFGSDIHTLVDSTGNTGSWMWQDIQYAETDTGRIRISSIDFPGITDTSDSNFRIRTDLTIDVTEPHGGEIWVQFTTHQITWNSGLTGGMTVDIDFSKDNFVSDIHVIEHNVPDTGSYDWEILYEATETAKVRVSSHDNPEVFDISDGNFSIIEGPIVVTQPNGGEHWSKFATEQILWNSGLAPGATVDIDFSTDGFVADIQVIEHNVSDTGSYNWTITFNATNSARIRVRSTDTPSNYDISNGNFEIMEPGIWFTHPIPGEELLAGSPYEIQWDGDQPIGDVKIEWHNGDANWADLVASTPNDKKWIWDPVPMEQTTTAQLRISFVTAPDVNDLLDNFKISIPTFTVTDPDNSDTWVIGTPHTIYWTSDGVTGNVKIDLVIGASVYPITGNTADSGSYGWTVGNYPSDVAQVRVSSVDNPSISGLSEPYFTIQGKSIEVKNPYSYETWVVGGNGLITWFTWGVDSVDIELDHGEATYHTIATDVPTTDGIMNTYNWTVGNYPYNNGSGHGCYIIIYDHDNHGLFDESEAPGFLINP